ncbi:MAG: repeat-containing protein, partial [Caulobacteraceae bacterium]|nr:repeat-containing protein [Caulobacteraceae bacterium]
IEGLRVGLCWAGGARPDQPIAHAIDLRRSLPLTAFRPLADLSHVRLISLQKGPPSAELSEANGWPGAPIVDLTHDLNDFVDTAALVANLDLVIACDTSTAHLAGAVGKPVWILNRFDGCWRWGHGRNDSPWYPTARLFTQASPGDWAGVIEGVTASLA